MFLRENLFATALKSLKDNLTLTLRFSCVQEFREKLISKNTNTRHLKHNLEIWNSNWTNIGNLRPSHVCTLPTPKTASCFLVEYFTALLFNNFSWYSRLWNPSCFIAFIKGKDKYAKSESFRVSAPPKLSLFLSQVCPRDLCNTPLLLQAGKPDHPTQWSCDIHSDTNKDPNIFV